jgi:hypothetical protein
VSQIQSNMDAVKARSRQALLAAMESVGVEIEATAKARIAINYPPASSPGEPPHRRTGELQAGVFHYTEETVSGVRTTISYGRAGGPPQVPEWLQYGTARMRARPFASVDRDEWAARLGALLTEQMRGQIT